MSADLAETESHLPGWEGSTQEGTPFEYPQIETHLIEALVQMDTLRVRAAELVEIIKTSPRDAVKFNLHFRAAYDAWNKAGVAYWDYHSIISCRGHA